MMTNLINLISERKFTEAEHELSSMFVSIMEQKLFEMKKATAAKMCEGIMGTVGPTRAEKLRSDVLEAADPKEDSATVERGTPQPPKAPENTTVIQKSQPGSTHYKNMEEETEQLDELSDKAKKAYVDAVHSKPGIFKSIRRSSLAGIEGDKQALKTQVDRSEKDSRQSAWSTSDLKRAYGNLKKKQQRRKNIADKVAASLEESVTVKKKDYSWGKMVTVHHGNKVSYPLHPEHQEKIGNLKHDEKTSFKDETGSIVTAHRDGDTIHLNKNKHNETTSVPFHHFEKDLSEARINIIKARVRGGKVQRRKKVSNVPGMTIRGGQLKRMSAAERRRRKMGARKGKIKRMAKMSRALMKRKRSLQKRKSLGL